jgi:hypothetical protein
VISVCGIVLALGGIVIAVRNGRLRDAMPFLAAGFALVLIDASGVYGR